MKNIIVAIDGHSGCGKSSTAKAVARRLNFTYIDSGAMYRAAALYLKRLNINPDEREKIKESISEIRIDFEKDANSNFTTILNGENVEEEIRSMEINRLVSRYSVVPQLREAMVSNQRMLSKNRNVIMDGRDIGTIVFPNADLKFFMTADLKVRALRRQNELAAQGKIENLDVVMQNLAHRDEIDSTRESSPLIQADDAMVIDTTNLTMEHQIEMVVNLAAERMKE
ncbi:MAG TPA: (d)CMP kinase [Cyclobacteriaceae bacterium]|jgi:cytidylate kinase